MSATRNRRNRQDKTVRDNQLVGGIRVSARRYCTGRVEIDVMNLVPSTGEQAAQLGFGGDE
jgi:hypothetical protein